MAQATGSHRRLLYDRLNPEGIPRSDLIWALTERRFVRMARRLDKCLLCRRGQVNESGICGVCWATLEEDELKLALKWLSGERA